MPTAEQNLKQELTEAQDYDTEPNSNARLQKQLDLVVAFVTRRTK